MVQESGNLKTQRLKYETIRMRTLAIWTHPKLLSLNISEYHSSNGVGSIHSIFILVKGESNGLVFRKQGKK